MQPDGTLAATPEVAQAIGAGAWLSWVVNLLVAEWWLHHTRHRSEQRSQQRTSHRRSAGTPETLPVATP